MATSVGGVLTGRGGDFLIIDDPLKPDDALSDTQRKACNEWFDHSLYSRLNNKKDGCIILIMQLLHEDDLVGHLSVEPWKLIRFPAIADEDETHMIETPYELAALSGALAKLFILNESHLKYSTIFARLWENTTLPADTSRLRRRWAADY